MGFAGHQELQRQWSDRYSCDNKCKMETLWIMHEKSRKLFRECLHTESEIHIGNQAVSKIIPKPRRLSLIKPITINQIGFGLCWNFDVHSPRFSSHAFASDHGEILDWPCSILWLRFLRTSPCQAGESSSAVLLQRLCQTVSSNFIFSATDITSSSLSIEISKTPIISGWRHRF